MTPLDPKLIEEWKLEHARCHEKACRFHVPECAYGPNKEPHCKSLCAVDEWPCPTSLLIAEVERLERLVLARIIAAAIREEAKRG